LPEEGREEAMAMDAALKQLEEKIEVLLKAYRASEKKEAELSARVEELEAKLSAEAESGERISAMETQRKELGTRLEKVLAMIDDALPKGD
jgi:chaperonin cofactor prefoldin